MHLEAGQDLGGGPVQRRQRLHAGRQGPVRDPAAQIAVEEHAAADRLGQHEGVPRARAHVAPVALRVHETGDGEAELGLLVVGRVASGEHGAGLQDLLAGAGDDAGQHLGAEDVPREAQQVQGRQGAAAHGVDIAQGVGRGDPAEEHGIVHRRRDDVRREHEGALVVEPVDGRVVARLEPHEEVRVDLLREPFQQSGESDRTHFRRSAAGPGQARERLVLVRQRHSVLWFSFGKRRNLLIPAGGGKAAPPRGLS